MAKQTINIGTTANDGTGDQLRSAFDKVNDNFTELYSDDAGDVGSITATAPIARDQATGAVTISLNDAGISTAKLADDAITHDKLSVRYTNSVSITTLTGTVSFNCANGSVFKLSGDLTGAYTISLTGYKKGQIITIYPLKGNQTLNLAGAGSSTNTFNKLGGVNYNDDGSTSNILQIECVDDSATDPIFFYSLATFAADSSDI